MSAASLALPVAGHQNSSLISEKDNIPSIRISDWLNDSSLLNRMQRVRNFLHRGSKEAVSFVRRQMDQHAPTIEIASECAGVISYIASARIVNLVLGLMYQSSTAAPSSSSTLISQAISCLKATKVAAAILVPIALASTIKEIIQLGGEHRIDAGLRSVDSFAWTIETTSMSLCGFNMLGVVSDAVASIAMTSIISSWGISHLVTGALNLKHLIQSRKFLQDLLEERVNKSDAISIRTRSNEGVIQLVQSQSDYQISQHFNVNSEILKGHLKTIQSNSTSDIAQETAVALTNRVSQKMRSNKLAILSSIIALIGVAILLFTPIAPVAYSLLALASAVALYRAYYDRKHARLFMANLANLAEASTKALESRPAPPITVAVPVSAAAASIAGA